MTSNSRRREGARWYPIRYSRVLWLPVLLFAGSTGLHQLTHDNAGTAAGEPIYHAAEHAAAPAHLEAWELPDLRSCLLCLRHPKPFGGLAVVQREVRLAASGAVSLPADHFETSAVARLHIPRAPPTT